MTIKGREFNPADRVWIASGRVSVTRLAFGTAPIAGLYAHVDDASAQECLAAAGDLGIRYIDTAPAYGSGLAERRVGEFLGANDDGDWTISTKVGHLVPRSKPAPRSDLPSWETVVDFSAGGVRRSLAESRERMGGRRIDIALLHDPEEHIDLALTEALPVLVEMRETGEVGAIGVGANLVDTMHLFATETPIDCILMAGRYTLLDQTALDTLLPACSSRGVDVLAAGVFNSGILADPGVAEPHYDYFPADAEKVARARAIAEVCAQHGIPLPAAALQFPFSHPAIQSVVVGVQSAQEIQQNARWLAQPIPAALWKDLEREGFLPSVPVR